MAAVVVPVLGTIVRLVGSSRMVPNAPCGALVSAVPVSTKPLPPDSSTVPPFPPALPPRAVTFPATVVLWVLSTVTRPPLPAAVASAETRAPAAIVVRAEVNCWGRRDPWARARVVPMATTPPPALPAAVTRAVGAMVVASLPNAITWPPRLPGA